LEKNIFARKHLDKFIVIVYNYSIKDVPFKAIVETFTQTVDKEATQSARIGEVTE